MAPWRGEDISSFEWLTCHLKPLQPQGQAVPPGAGREGALGRACPVAPDWQPHHPLALAPLWLGFTLRWEDVEQTSPTSPAARPSLSLHLGTCLFLHHHLDRELPGDTHTTSFTTEASSQSWSGISFSQSPWHTQGEQTLNKPVVPGRQLTKCPADPSAPPWE